MYYYRLSRLSKSGWFSSYHRCRFGVRRRRMRSLRSLGNLWKGLGRGEDWMGLGSWMLMSRPRRGGQNGGMGTGRHACTYSWEIFRLSRSLLGLLCTVCGYILNPLPLARLLRLPLPVPPPSLLPGLPISQKGLLPTPTARPTLSNPSPGSLPKLPSYSRNMARSYSL